MTEQERLAAIERVDRRRRLAKLRARVESLVESGGFSYDEQRVLVGMHRSMTDSRPGMSDMAPARIQKARRKLERKGLAEDKDLVVDGSSRFGPLTRHGARVARDIREARGREFDLDEHALSGFSVRQCTGKPSVRPALTEEPCCFFPVYDPERRGERVHTPSAQDGRLWIFRLETVICATDRAAWSIRRHITQ